MPLWKKLWLLFTVIWVGVCALSAATILAVGGEFEREQAFTPIVLAFAVPPVVYLFAGGIAWWRRRSGRED